MKFSPIIGDNTSFALSLFAWSCDASISSNSCGEEELVRGVHTLVAGVVQVHHRLHVVEEEEKGRKVEQEVEREDQGEETAHTWMAMEMT